jgi:hypothetical protein
MMSWFTNLLGIGNTALNDSDALPSMEAEARSPRAGKQQRCSVCGKPGHKRPSHAVEIELELRAAITKLEAGKAEAEERAQLSAAESRELWAMIDKLWDRVRLAESIAQMGTYGEGTSI